MVWAHKRSTELAKMTHWARYKEGEGKADRKRDGKIIYQNGQDKGWVKPFEKMRTESNGEKWLPDHP